MEIRTIGDLRAALDEYAADAELVLNIDTRHITIDPALIVAVEYDEPAAGQETGAVHLLIGDWKP